MHREYHDWEASEFKDEINCFCPLICGWWSCCRPLVSIVDITGCLVVLGLCTGFTPPALLCEFCIITWSDYPERDSLFRNSPCTEACQIQKLLLAEAFCLIDHTKCSTQSFYFNNMCWCFLKESSKDNSSITTQPQPQPQNASVTQVPYALHSQAEQVDAVLTISNIKMDPNAREEIINKTEAKKQKKKHITLNLYEYNLYNI